jgi:hypothetical protein
MYMVTYTYLKVRSKTCSGQKHNTTEPQDKSFTHDLAHLYT